MEYRLIKKFRDGTYMVEIDGKTQIVDADMNQFLIDKNWPAMVTKKIKEKFPHVMISVSEDPEGIRTTISNGETSMYYVWRDGAKPESIHATCMMAIASMESEMCAKDKNYFIENYINKYNKYE